ncbi:MAG: DUF190 domain-containing protein [Anaerosomatales bacterium]|nr:DUF190 domain-containing protein [Coriobacteriia bacterium]MDI6692727.1 DUF190 domain-containing protein [Anaerosomatales bacterium]MDI6843869.1 DUF190 domain-containing protein [Anaerosomatales bacterium]GAV31016.1 uncharacterized conserved protein [Coriobacteriaceae bacterium EMTCatB1]
MHIEGDAKRVTIYVGESDRWHGRPLHDAILELLRSEGCAGATVIRGVAGFGKASRLHTASILRLSQDLPVVIEWVDDAERVAKILPRLDEMVEGGLVTIEDVHVLRYVSHEGRRDA